MQVATLFERAFAPSNNRPTAAEWSSALRSLSQNLTKCNVNAGHHHLKSLSACPWCKLEKETGVKLFLGVILQNLGQRGFDLAKVWREISSIVLPPDSFPTTASSASRSILNQALNPFGTVKYSVADPEVIGLRRILVIANLVMFVWLAGSVWWMSSRVHTGIFGCIVGFVFILLI
jgi:hypothetical protein